MPAMAPPERREHSRHPIRAEARISRAGQCWTVDLADMSLQGAGLILREDLPLDEGDEISLTIELEDVDEPDVTDVLNHQPRKLLRLRGTLVYCRETATDESSIGVEYRPISEVDQVLLTLLLTRP